MILAIRKQFRNVLALLALVVIGLLVSGYILSNQRFDLPGWVPLVGKDYYTVKAEFNSAEAVVPGQGQTVNVAGVPVGQIAKVELKGGVARITLDIQKKHSPIYRDATMLLRPKTGLKDMIVDMDPGTPGAGKVAENGVVPVGNTAPDVDPDEILSSLDTDTRAYLEILLNAGGEAFSDPTVPADLRETFKRFEPTNRSLAKLTGELSKRRRNVARVVHNLRLLMEELGTKDRQIASLVDSANANFRALASQDANIRSTLQLLPQNLRTADSTLDKANRMARVLGPTLEHLRPAARALGPALRETRPFLRITRPIIQNQLRPFARTARGPVRDLRTAARALAPVTPRLTRVFGVLNSFFNTLAFNPPGPEEGYLFWSAWINHNGATVFNTQDAHGPIRRGNVVASCQSLELLEALVQQNPNLRVLQELLRAPREADVCPGQVPESPKAKKKDEAAPPAAEEKKKAPPAGISGDGKGD